MNRSKGRSTDQKFDQPIKSLINRLRVRSTGSKAPIQFRLDSDVVRWRSTDQKVDKQINISKVRSTVRPTAQSKIKW